MTTDGIIELQRDINVLLEMDTFQDMTDAEIQSVIDYFRNMGRMEGRIEATLDEQLIAEQQIVQAHIANVEASKAVLQSMLDMKIPWVTVGGDS